MRNNAGRMAQMTDMMLGAHETAMRMVASMQKVGIKLRVRMDKMNRQKAKSNKKSIKKGQPVVTQSAGQAMVMDILKKKNGGDAPSGTPAPSPAPSPVDDKKGGTDNIDDIL